MKTKKQSKVQSTRYKVQFAITAVLFYCLLLLPTAAFAQNVGISAAGTVPNNSAMLDVVSTSRGMLIPRMLQSDRNSIVSPANSLLIYQTDNTPGYYYNSGTPASPVWELVGTGWTDDGTVVRLTTSTDNVGIGTTGPAAKLDVDGSIFVTGGSGDVNEDGSLTISDATNLVNYLTTGATRTRSQLAKADVNADGLVTFEDVQMITAMIVGYTRERAEKATYKIAYRSGSGSIDANDNWTDRKFIVDGSIEHREGTAVALVNGANNDIALGTHSYFRVTGPTAAFTVSGFTGGADGRIVTIYNTTAQVMTIADNKTSTAANQILTLKGADIVAPAGPNVIQLQYNSSVSRWLVIGGQNLTATSAGAPGWLIYTASGF